MQTGLHLSVGAMNQQARYVIRHTFIAGTVLHNSELREQQQFRVSRSALFDFHN
jgi:hypothetical protein